MAMADSGAGLLMGTDLETGIRVPTGDSAASSRHVGRTARRTLESADAVAERIPEMRTMVSIHDWCLGT